MSRRLLQITNVILAILTVGLAGNSIIFGTQNSIYGLDLVPESAALDSNLRFMGGLGLGLGLALLWLIPTIEKHGLLFRTIWIAALLGGIGRLISFFVVGLPPVPMILFTIIEVPGVPLLIYWQYRVSKQFTVS